MLNDPEEAIQSLLASVNEADAEDIEAARPWNVTVGVGFGRAQCQPRARADPNWNVTSGIQAGMNARRPPPLSSFIAVA